MGMILPQIAIGVLLLLLILGVVVYYRDHKSRKEAQLKEDPSPPQPGHYLLAASFLVTLAVLGAIMPLEYRPAPREVVESEKTSYWERLVRHGDMRPELELSEEDKQFAWPIYIFGATYYVPLDTSDIVGNYLIAIPLGFLWMGVFCVDRYSYRAALLGLLTVTIAGTAFRIVLEFVQYFVSTRIISRPDIICEFLGVLTGAIIWVAAGQRITDWLRSKSLGIRRGDFVDKLLLAYFFGFVIYSMLPMEFVLRGRDLGKKFQNGLLVFTPFSEVKWQPIFWIALLTYIPVGMIAARAFTTPRRPVRPLAMSFMIAGAIVLAIEFSQIFIMYKFTSITEFFAGLVGVALGVSAMFLWHAGKIQEDGLGATSWAHSAAPFLALAAVYTAVVIVLSCTPFDPLTESELIRVRFHGFFQLDFSAGPNGSIIEVMAQMIGKALIYVPLAAFLALPCIAPQVPASVRGFLLACVVVFCTALSYSIEMVQVYLPNFTADMTDTVSCAFGALATVTLVAIASRLRTRKLHQAIAKHA